eukprot:symbB.v1.2.038587.t1/scaffold6065.1/size21245/1
MSPNAPPHLYDVEVLKLLKALQTEELQDYAVKLDGLIDRQTSGRIAERDPTLEAVDAVCGWLSGSWAFPMDMLTTEEEVKRAGLVRKLNGRDKSRGIAMPFAAEELSLQLR